MAFFCPGSGPKIKKEAESKQRPHNHPEWQHHNPPHTYNTRNGIHSHSRSVTDKVQDVSRSQPHVGDQFLKKLLVRCDHTQESPTELAVRKGEMVELIKRDKDWLFVRNDRGKEGYVPNNKCFTPMGSSRPRINSINGPKVVHQVTTDHTPDTPNRVIPMYSSSSAGRVHRHRSPLPDPEQENLVGFKRVQSPHVSPNGTVLSSHENSLPVHDPKYSPSSSSGVASDPYSPAMVRAYSQDELKPRQDDDSMCSLSQPAANPLAQPPIRSFKDELQHNGHRKQSSSDDSGTVDIKEIEYASTIRTGDTSSEDGSMRPGRGSTRSNTPSIRDRPLPSPPKEVGKNEEAPPLPPPRTASLDRNKRGPRISPGDMDPYATPIDSLVNGNDSPTSILSEQTKGRRDVQCKDAGINSPYSEVFRPPKGYRRPVNLQDVQSSPQHPHRPFHRNRSPVAMPNSVERRDSPLTINEDQPQHNYTPFEAPAETAKGLTKFRKTRWGVYVCTEEFEAIDENEVSVAEGEQVMVFNQDDSQWYWVVKHKTDNSEGFVPSYILKEVTQNTPTIKHSIGLPEVHVARTSVGSMNAPSLPSVPPTSLPSVHTPSLPNAHTPSLPNAHAPSLPNAHAPSLPNAHAPSLPNAHTPSLPNAHAPSLPNAHTPSLPNVPPRMRNYSTSHTAKPTSHRTRVNSTGSNNVCKVNVTSSIDKIPQDLSNFVPSSPPPPYTILDPAPHSTAVCLSQGNEREVVTPVMAHTHSHNISRSRPPTFPSARGRVSVPHFQPPLPNMSPVSRSSSHLASPVETAFHERHNFPTTPMATTSVGGTLV